MRVGSGPFEQGKKYQTILASSMNSFSRGTVHLQSSDPLVPPAINPAYFSNPLDLQIMVAAMKFVRKLSTVEPFASTIITPVEPGPLIQTDEQFTDYCNKNMQTVFHPVGTASMLPKEDGGVVSPSLLVYGTKNIRVVRFSLLLSCLGGDRVS
jgi:choline dehydrogenase-like flavoprotein